MMSSTPEKVDVYISENEIDSSGEDSEICTAKSGAETHDSQTLKTYEEACKHFRSQGGITYVSNELWIKYRAYCVDSHIFVGTATTDQATLKTTAGASNNAGETITMKGTLPFRFRLINDRLLEDMRRIIGLSALNHDHVAPFRSIVPYEQQFRARLRELEEDFSRLAESHPGDPAVTRTRQWLPWIEAYGTQLGTRAEGFLLTTDAGLDKTSALDNARILLDGFRAFIFWLNHDLADVVRTFHEARQGTLEKIPFVHLWHLFWPGQEIIAHQHNRQVSRVLQASGGRRSLTPRKGRSFRNTISDLIIDCFYLDYDGKQLRAVAHTIAIKPYVGERPVTSLDVYPLQYEKQTTKADIIKRGWRFVGLIREPHKRYTGLNLTADDFHRYEEIDSDVIVDFELAYRSSEEEIKRPTFGGGVILAPTEEDEEETRGEEVWYDDEEFRSRAWSEFVHHTSLLDDRRLEELDDDRLLLLPGRVFGYVLLSRKWYPLSIDLITDLKTIKEGEHDAFDDLVLPKRHRNIIRALVKTHARGRGALNSKSADNPVQREFDIVRGKGKGLIILLHGAPGVGKTSMAECVAAHTGRPLFPITCGDLGGNTAQEVEQNLERFFDLAMKWGCVLLLDEADVFLGERIQGNIVQNSLVSVFLRVLEYYSGILILTTNRVGQFDEAATSRIHCALYYPPFSKKRNVEVWQKNVDRLKRANEKSLVPVKFNEKRIMKFAERQWEEGNRWNGRQIKNAFQTAVAMSDWDHMKKEQREKTSIPELRTKHFKAVVETSNHFESYLTAVRRSDRERAKMNTLRRDDLAHNIQDYYYQTPKKGSVPAWPGAEESDDSSSDSDDQGEDETGDSDSESETDSGQAKRKKAKKDKEKQKEKERKKRKNKPKSKKSSKSKKESESSGSSSSSDSEIE